MTEFKLSTSENKQLVEKHLQAVFDDFISLFPESFHADLRQNLYIAGGSIYSIWNNKEVNDYDFFVTNEKTLNRLISYFQVLKYNRIKNVQLAKWGDHNICLTDYAISIDKKYQIIVKFSGYPWEVVQEFDIKNNMFYFYIRRVHTLSDWKFLDTKYAKFNEERARDIASCIARIGKIERKGLRFEKKEIVKMLKKFTELGEDNGLDKLSKISEENY